MGRVSRRRKSTDAGGVRTLKIYLGYLAIMAIGTTVLAIWFAKDRREAKEELAKAAKKEEEDD